MAQEMAARASTSTRRSPLSSGRMGRRLLAYEPTMQQRGSEAIARLMNDFVTQSSNQKGILGVVVTAAWLRHAMPGTKAAPGHDVSMH
jgi:hypothetical protein